MFDGLLENLNGRTYLLSSWLFLRLLGVIYGVAFVSLAIQIKGLVGRRGILPAAEFLAEEKLVWRAKRFFLLPTLCWWNDKDSFLRFLCWGGAFLSLLLVLGVAPGPVLVLLWLFYLSLLTVARIFLGYQWDILLLETGFLAIFLAPLELVPTWPPETLPSPVVRWLLYWLLFRLMFASGFVKLRSQDATWRNLTALTFHYETQPLPTPLSWYAHQWPVWFQKLSAVIMFVIELVVPFLIFCPGSLSHVAGVTFMVFMLLIMATGNYCFFNLLTIALCVLLFDDAVYEPIFHFLLGGFEPGSAVPSGWGWWMPGLVALVVLLLSLESLSRLFRVKARWLTKLEKVCAWLEPFRIVNSYGLFSVMSTTRLEIIVEGSKDGKIWLPYEFKWKPGEVSRAPRWCAPHQPRLDWQMWFAALGDYRANPWFIAFVIRLLQGSSAVLGLLRRNPFPDQAPLYVRAMLYEYHFADRATRHATSAWWQRKKKWLYCPVYSLRGREDQFMPPVDEDADWSDGRN